MINNAGTNIRGPVEQLTEADWDAVLDTNLKGPFLCARAVGAVTSGINVAFGKAAPGATSPAVFLVTAGTRYPVRDEATILVDLRKIPGLHGIQQANGGWRIGPMTRHADLQETNELGVVARAPTAREAAERVFHVSHSSAPCRSPQPSFAEWWSRG